MRISWNGGELILEEAWIEDKTKAEVYTRRTITGEPVVFLPVWRKYTIRVNACTFEEAQTLKSLAESGTTITIDDDGFVVSGKIKKVELRHFIEDVKESAIRQRINLYHGKVEVEA
ncbi:hypothetical protein JCM9492_11000 [Aquifex pyrophilus]